METTATAPLATAEPNAPDTPKSHHRRTGKIARLTQAARDKLNQMLADGVFYAAIIAQLGPEGAELNEQNISRWKDGGHQDWLKNQEQDILFQAWRSFFGHDLAEFRGGQDPFAPLAPQPTPFNSPPAPDPESPPRGADAPSPSAEDHSVIHKDEPPKPTGTSPSLPQVDRTASLITAPENSALPTPNSELPDNPQPSTLSPQPVSLDHPLQLAAGIREAPRPSELRFDGPRA